ncbi:profilin [Nonomuraea sp. NPDC046802]|uniref:profilin n=1 Tax=Nonomuraea sp. NPDC046802 TaxID=3154919 RepID=UPI0033F370BF
MGDWQRYVDHNLIGSGKVNRAAIVGLDGETLAASEGYTLSPEEQRSLIDGFKDLSRVQASGLKLAGQKFFVIETIPDRSIYLKKQADGATVVKTKRCIIIAEYDAPVQGPESTPIVESLADDLISAGN